MKSLKVISITTLFFASFYLSCSKEVNSKTNFVFKDAPTQGIVMRFKGENVKASDLFKNVEQDIYEAEMKLYELKLNQIRSHVLKMLMENDPRKKGLSNDEFLEKHISGGVKVSKNEIDAFVKERKIPKEQLNDQMIDRVKKYLEVESKKVAIEKWMAEQTKNNPVEVYLTKPERPVRNVVIGDAPFTGGKNAKVTIVEFSDFQCPYCAEGAKLVNKLKKKYGNKVKIVFKHFPLPFHKQAQKAAEAASCARDQKEKAFWTFHDEMFASQDKLAISDLENIAKKARLKMDEFKKCLSSSKHAGTVATDQNHGKDAGVKSTPTFFVNGKMIPGAQSVDVFSDIIDRELAK